MLVWFAVLAPVIVAEVFQSPMVDYRIVALGALLPLADALFGGACPLHTLVMSVLVMTAVMLGTMRRRLVRRALLGIPIGMFLHLVLDFTWTDSAVFWWPAFGLGFEGGSLAFDRPLAVNLVLELVAIAVGYWAYHRYLLDDPVNRRLLVEAGRLDRSAVRR